MLVQFASSAKKVIISVFEDPQDKEVFPNQGEVEDDDPRYLAFINPPAPTVEDPIEKLSAFLSENPDVASKLGL